MALDFIQLWRFWPRWHHIAPLERDFICKLISYICDILRGDSPTEQLFLIFISSCDIPLLELPRRYSDVVQQVFHIEVGLRRCIRTMRL